MLSLRMRRFPSFDLKGKESSPVKHDDIFCRETLTYRISDYLIDYNKSNPVVVIDFCIEFPQSTPGTFDPEKFMSAFNPLPTYKPTHGMEVISHSTKEVTLRFVNLMSASVPSVLAMCLLMDKGFFNSGLRRAISRLITSRYNGCPVDVMVETAFYLYLTKQREFGAPRDMEFSGPSSYMRSEGLLVFYDFFVKFFIEFEEDLLSVYPKINPDRAISGLIAGQIYQKKELEGKKSDYV